MGTDFVGAVCLCRRVKCLHVGTDFTDTVYLGSRISVWVLTLLALCACVASLALTLASDVVTAISVDTVTALSTLVTIAP